MNTEKINIFPLTKSGLLLVVFLHALLALTAANTAPSYGLQGGWLEVVHAIGIVVLLGLYALAAYRLRQGFSIAPQHIVLCVILSAAPYLLNYATQSSDLYNYIAYAEISQHTSAYVQGPGYLGEDNPIVHGIWERWRPFPSPYGPAWTIIGNAIGTLHASLVTQLVIYKLIGVGVVLAIVQVLLRWSPKVIASTVALNPIFIIEFIGDGHNDGLFTLGILLAIATYSRPVLAGLSTGLSIATKHISLILSPIFVLLYLRSREYKKAILYAVGTLGVVATLYVCVWQGEDTFSGIFAVLPQFFAVPLFFPQKIILGVLRNAQTSVSLLTHLRTSAAIGLGIFSVIQIWVYWRVLRGRLSLQTAAFISLCAIILFGMQWVQPWYLTWPLALAAFLQPKYASRAIATITFVWFVSMYTTF